MFKFRINSCDGKNGPGIFGKRLSDQLKSFGWVRNENKFDYNIVFASGAYVKGAVNVLRLDNLYFDKDNTVGNTDKLNAKIKKAYNEFDKVIFQSQFAKDQYFSYFGKVTVPHGIICNGVPKLFCKRGDAANYPWKRILVCSADWRAHKRLESTIAGLDCLIKQEGFEDTGLIVLGRVKGQTIKRCNVRYLGWKTPTQLPYYLRGADAFVHLSWLDCCPNVVVEALACGLPVFSSHNGGTHELIKGDGVVVKLEKDYKFNRVRLYKPPLGDPKVVMEGMKRVLSMGKIGYRDDLYMESVACKYINFMVG